MLAGDHNQYDPKAYKKEHIFFIGFFDCSLLATCQKISVQQRWNKRRLKTFRDLIYVVQSFERRFKSNLDFLRRSERLVFMQLKQHFGCWPPFNKVASSIFLDEFSLFSLGLSLTALIMLWQMIRVYFSLICFFCKRLANCRVHRGQDQ